MSHHDFTVKAQRYLTCDKNHCPRFTHCILHWQLDWTLRRWPDLRILQNILFLESVVEAADSDAIRPLDGAAPAPSPLRGPHIPPCHRVISQVRVLEIFGNSNQGFGTANLCPGCCRRPAVQPARQRAALDRAGTLQAPARSHTMAPAQCPSTCPSTCRCPSTCPATCRGTLFCPSTCRGTSICPSICPSTCRWPQAAHTTLKLAIMVPILPI